ncbi:nucleolin 1-like isoform X2 [Arachis stenosperma]|uniref:nucleolin 1-like isoform X2 n=1 Tax=Arachis stenosperma TaxID=217475 RepID=UPI0025AD2443|nr:nucleolin 1-like isoform X2 [Arachis stenosperma]
MVDADSAKKVSKTPSTPSVAAGGSKTLFVGNLSFSLQRSDFEEFFKDCGEVVDVRFSVDDTGRFKRFRHVEFAIAEAAQSALELNEHELLNHPVRLDLARERVSAIPSRKVISVKLVKLYSQGVLINLLEKREISRVSVPKDFKSGGPKWLWWLMLRHTPMIMRSLRKLKQWGSPNILKKKLPWKLLEP